MKPTTAAGHRRHLALVAIALWFIMFVAVAVRVAHQPLRNTVFPTYRLAGEHWYHAQPLYQGAMGFVYSPIAAAAMVPFAFLPEAAAGVLWRLLSVVAFVAALLCWRKSPLLPHGGWAALFLLLIPFTLGNLNNGQANILVSALLLGAVAAARRAHWIVAATCVALATYLKIYPLVLGILLVVAYPRQLGLRMLLALLFVGALGFLLQHPAYVAAQYRHWLETRLLDNRLHWNAINAPQDLWRLLLPFHISERFYAVIRGGSALFVAAVAWQGRRRGWSTERLLVAIFALGCAWMILLGPATESATYVLLAPALVLAFIHAFTAPLPPLFRAGITVILVCEVVALALVSFSPWRHDPIILIQPFGALLFFVYGLCWAQSEKAWESNTSFDPARE